MKKLLDLNSPKYLRRLAKKVRLAILAGRSIYAIDVRDGKRFRVRGCRHTGGSVLRCAGGILGDSFAREFFDDGAGEEIVASQEV